MLPPASKRDTLPTLVDPDVFDGGTPGKGTPRLALMQTSGFETGRLLSLLPDKIILGRTKDAACAFADTRLLPVQAVLTRAGSTFLLEAAAQGGTHVNGAALARATLRIGDRLRMRSVTLKVAELRDDEALSLSALYEESERDGTTGVLSGRHLDALLAEDVAYAVRHREPFSLGLFDLDSFHAVVEREGFAATDQLLTLVAKLITDNAPADARVFRTGGDEFAIAVRGDADTLRVSEALAAAKVMVRSAKVALADVEEKTPSAMLALARRRLRD